MLRRTVLLGSTALAGCQYLPDKNIDDVAYKVDLLADGLQGMLLRLGELNLPILTPSIMATVGSAVADIQSIAKAVHTVYTDAAAQPLLKKIETYLNAIVGALAKLPLPPPLPQILQAAMVILPFVEAMVGMVVPQARGAGGMSEGEASAILLAARKSK